MSTPLSDPAKTRQDAARNADGTFGTQVLPEAPSHLSLSRPEPAGPFPGLNHLLDQDHGMEDWELGLAEEHELPVLKDAAGDRDRLERAVWQAGRALDEVSDEQVVAAMSPVRQALIWHGQERGNADMEARAALIALSSSPHDMGPEREDEWLGEGSRLLVEILVAAPDPHSVNTVHQPTQPGT
ncbi:hypothetical protein LG293_17295 (plasmid) [Citricoccus nitrophenolicus]